MTVLKGEGKVPILFGSMSITVATRLRHGYLSRPDLAGEWPTVIVVPDVWGVTPSIKDLCRKLARRELAAIAVDPFRDGGGRRFTDRAVATAALAEVPAHDLDADLEDVASFVTNPAGFWSSAEHGLGVLGIGTGGAAAARLADRRPGVALALVAVPLQPIAAILGPTSGLLGLYGRDDPEVPVEEVLAARPALPQAELVLYEGVGSDFLDDGRPGYDLDAATDAVERLTGFFIEHLPAAPAER
ncbi:MAG: dienelactone hydrolase family protein [Acidimicrobiia bacterium]